MQLLIDSIYSQYIQLYKCRSIHLLLSVSFPSGPDKSRERGKGTSLVVQWLRICLPMQGTLVRSLVREDPTCCGATKLMCQNYSARAPQLLKPMRSRARMPQLLKPRRLEPVLRIKRSHRNEKPAHRNEEWLLLAAARESPRAAMKTQRSQK